MVEYMYNDEIVGKEVTIDGITYPSKAFASLSELTPIATPPTLTEGQTMDWGAGSVVAGKWQRFTVRDKPSAEKMAEIRAKRTNLFFSPNLLPTLVVSPL